VAVIAGSCKRIGNRAGEHNSQYQKTYTVQYRLLTDDPLDGPGTVVNYSELPELYDSYSFGNDVDANVYLISKTPREESDGSFKTWVVTCEYSNAPPVDLEQNPISEPAKASMSFDQFTIIARIDTDGNALQNTVGQSFTPPPDMDQSRPVLTVRRNESYIDLNKAMDYTDSVNQTAWKGAPPRTVKLRALNYSDQQERNGVRYFEATYEFHLYDQTWDSFILNQATRYKPTASSTAYVDMPPGAEPVTLYTGEGGTTADVIVPRGTPVTREQVYVQKRIYKERNFNSLGLIF